MQLRQTLKDPDNGQLSCPHTFYSWVANLAYMGDMDDVSLGFPHWEIYQCAIRLG